MRKWAEEGPNDPQMHIDALAHDTFASSELESILEISKGGKIKRRLLFEQDSLKNVPPLMKLEDAWRGLGQYERADRAIFRPLQYCKACFALDSEWVYREIVQMSSLHLEGMVKRVSGVGHLPLGMALIQPLAKRRIDSRTWVLLKQINGIYNKAKHDFEHEKDTHQFTARDAVLMYFVCRRVASALYPISNLATDLTVFEDSPSKLREKP